jgi:hypothetical protein
MNKMGLKTLTAILMLGRRSRKHVNWTLTIAVICTLATVVLAAAYLFERFGAK